MKIEIMHEGEEWLPRPASQEIPHMAVHLVGGIGFAAGA